MKFLFYYDMYNFYRFLGLILIPFGEKVANLSPFDDF